MMEMAGAFVQNAKRHPCAALKWNPLGLKEVRKSRENRRRMLEKRWKKYEQIWNELKWLTQDRSNDRSLSVSMLYRELMTRTNAFDVCVWISKLSKD